MATSDPRNPHPGPGGEPDEPAADDEAAVAAAVNAFLDEQLGPEPVGEVERVDASSHPDTGAAEWAERVKETRYYM
jgi:hypothetical protein